MTIITKNKYYDTTYYDPDSPIGTLRCQVPERTFRKVEAALRKVEAATRMRESSEEMDETGGVRIVTLNAAKLTLDTAKLTLISVVQELYAKKMLDGGVCVANLTFKLFRKISYMDCSFSVEDLDILRNKRNVGLRHVSDRKLGVSEVLSPETNYGCSLNLDPHYFRKILNITWPWVLTGTPNWIKKYEIDQRTDDESRIQCVARKMTRLEQDNFLEKFQEGVDDFLYGCLSYNRIAFLDNLINLETGNTSFGMLANVANRSMFSLVEYGPYTEPDDLERWGKGLGRFTKETLKRKITPVPFVDAPSEGLERRIHSKEEVHNFDKEMILCYRRAIIFSIRTVLKNN